MLFSDDVACDGRRGCCSVMTWPTDGRRGCCTVLTSLSDGRRGDVA